MENILRNENNFRDLGGYVTNDHRIVKHGCFYRSAGLFKMNEQEISYIQSLHIKSILDLRSKWEYRKKPDPEIYGAEILNYSAVVSAEGREIDFSPRGMNKIGNDAYEQIDKLKNYYKEMPFQNPAFQKMFSVIEKDQLPLLIHCASGKDRTGVAVMVLLLALGVKEEIILKDYCLSNVYRKETIDKTFQNRKDDILNHPELRMLLQMKEGVNEDVGRLVLSTIKERYPNLDDFLIYEYHFTKTSLHLLRDKYTEIIQ